MSYRLFHTDLTDVAMARLLESLVDEMDCLDDLELEGDRLVSELKRLDWGLPEFLTDLSKRLKEKRGVSS